MSAGDQRRTGALAISAPRFVGRQRELATLRRALAGRPAAVLVEGEAGIGKSRLVRELLARPGSAQRATHALVGVCPPVRQPFTLGPVVDALRQATGRIGGLALTPLCGALRPLFPEWTDDLPAAPEPLADASAARHRLFRAIAEVLEQLSVRLMVVEDAHWADEATLELLLFLAAREDRTPSLLVTYRPEEVPADSLLRRFTSRPSVAARVSLRPLDAEDTARLVSSMLDDEPVSAEFAGFLCRHTDGLPLAIEESVRLLHDRADLVREDGGWVRRDLTEMVIPPSVRDAVLERAGRLGRPGQAVLRAAAVLGDPVAEPVLLAVAGQLDGRAGDGLAEALGSGLVAQDAQGLVAYRHALACRAVYESIPARELRHTHLRAGQALLDSSLEAARPTPDQLVRHFRAAGEPELWRGYAEQAADLALASGDPMTAVALLHDVLTQVRLPAAEVARLMRRIPIHVVTSDPRHRELVRSLRAVLDRDALSATERAEVGWHLSRMMIQIGDLETAYDELAQAVPHLADRPVDAAHAMVVLSWLGAGWAGPATHRRWLDRAAAIEQDPSIPAAERLALLGDRAAGLLALGEPGGWAVAAQLPVDGRTAGEMEQIARGCVNFGDAAIRWGRYGESARWLDRASELADAYQYRHLYDISQVTRLHLDWLTGAWDGLAKRAAAALSELDGKTLMRTEALLVAGALDAATGAARAAAGELSLAVETGRRPGILDASQEPAAALAELHLAAGRVTEALAVTDEPMGTVTDKRLWLWATDVTPVRVRALLAAGRPEEAERLVAAFGRGLRARGLNAAVAPAPWAALVACRAALAEGRGRQNQAAALFGRAAQAWQALPRPYAVLLSRERQAGCLLAAGREEAGLDLLSQVHQGLSGLGARADAERVKQALRRNGMPVGRGGRPSYGDQLSPRELEVVRLLATGRTNREIARAMSLSPRTVASHIDSAMRKHHAPSRTALLMSAVEAGVVPVARSAPPG